MVSVIVIAKNFFSSVCSVCMAIAVTRASTVFTVSGTKSKLRNFSYIPGEDLLVKPVTTQGQSTIDVYLPGKDEVRSLLFRATLSMFMVASVSLKSNFRLIHAATAQFGSFFECVNETFRCWHR